MRISSVGLAVVLTGCSGATPFADELVGPTPAPSHLRLSAVAPPDGSSTVAVSTQFVRATEDGHGLVIRVEYPDLCQELLGVHVDERQTSVRVVAVATRPTDVCPLRLAAGDVEVALEAPLGERTVISG